MFTNIVEVSHCHKLEIACCFAVHLPYRYVLRKGSSSMMRLSSTEGTDGGLRKHLGIGLDIGKPPCAKADCCIEIKGVGGVGGVVYKEYKKEPSPCILQCLYLQC